MHICTSALVGWLASEKTFVASTFSKEELLEDSDAFHYVDMASPCHPCVAQNGTDAGVVSTSNILLASMLSNHLFWVGSKYSVFNTCLSSLHGLCA